MVALLAILRGLPWRLIGAGILTLAIILTGVRIMHWHDAYKALPGLEDALAREEACEDGSRCYERQRGLQEAARHATVVAVESYEAELAALRNRPVPDRVIRVCRAARDVPVSSTPGAPDGASASAGLVHGPTEFDPRALFELAREADEVAARLRALQDYSRALAGPSEGTQ